MMSCRWFARLCERPPRWHEASPRETALALLAPRFATDAAAPATAPGASFDLASFQEHAVQRARQILHARGGVLVADSVGLGKTFVALALIEAELARGGRVLVAAPAALRRDWLSALRRLPAAPGRLTFVSHARLSRGTHEPERLRPLSLVVADEAHAFRSPHTRRYRALAELCRGIRVVLLTATPVNNSLADLYHQLRLFAADDAFRDLGVPSMASAFAAASDAGRALSSASLLALLRAVVIRRTRPFLREHYAGVRVPGPAGTVLDFPRRAPPHPVRYSLADVYAGGFDELATAIARLRFAAFGLGAEEQRRRTEPELLRLLLVKRLESSVAAFRLSVARQLRFHEAALDALARGQVLTAAEHRARLAGGDADVVQLVLDDLVLRALPARTDRAALSARVRADTERLRTLYCAVAPLQAAADPKLHGLEQLLDAELRTAKVIVFTEFRDTARYLWRALARRGSVALIDGAAAFLGTQPATRRQVIERFAPRANGVAEPRARERVQLLIATDVLSEGLNLQDAAHVISYDLPWNPVRLIQRVGRVDRLGSPHDVVHAYHFLPDRGIEQLLRLLARLRTKLDAIAQSIGAEAPVLGPGDDVPRDFNAYVDRLAAGDAGVLEDAERRDAEPFEREERLRLLCAQARAGGEGRTRVWYGGTAPAAVMAAAPDSPPLVLVGLSVNGTPAYCLVNTETWSLEDVDADAELLRALESERGADGGISSALLDRAAAVAREDAVARALACRGAGAASSSSVQARAIRTLLAAMSAVTLAPDPALCDRADALLAALARGPSAGTEAALARALANAGELGVEALLSRLADALGMPALLPEQLVESRAESREPIPPLHVKFLGAIELRPAARG